MIDRTPLAAAVRDSVKARGDKIKPEHKALVEATVRLAEQIDAGVEKGGETAVKTCYLVPHLVKTLDKLGCVPAPQAIESATGQSESQARADELAAKRAKYRGRA